MKNSFPLLFLFAATFSSQDLHSQTLPDAMYFSENEHILYTNGQISPTGGLYDESQIRTIELWFEQTNYWNS